MKVSGFTFLKNAHSLGYPFVESIRSVLPLVDEFIVSLGPCTDDTQQMIEAIGDPRIRIIHTSWNDRIVRDAKVKGFVYGQQKSIALFNCTGDWAFYIEGDEVVHEDDLPKIRAAMERHLDDKRVEALTFDYVHFYGNKNTYAWSPAWYRREPRIIRNTVPVWAPKGLFFLVMENNKAGRYPYAAHTDARIFHYGWVRSREQMAAKCQSDAKYWGSASKKPDYTEIDPQTLHLFTGTHPAVIEQWLPDAVGLFQSNPDHKLTRRERKHRWAMKLERLFGLELSKKHFKVVR